MARLDGKVAFVTGAARGMGRHHALRMAAEGADIIAVDICRPVGGQQCPGSSEEDLAETVDLVKNTGRRIVANVGDVRDEEALVDILNQGVEELGRLDIVVANAGIDGPGLPVDQYPLQTFRDIVETNLTGAFVTVKSAVPHLRASGGGSIVLISSVLGVRGMPHVPAYTAAKHGVIGLMRSLAIELGPAGIRVNAICPATTATVMCHNEVAFRLFRPDLENPGKDDMAEVTRGLHLLDIPWLEVDDISEGVLYLVSGSGRYVTGLELKVDGGWSAK